MAKKKKKLVSASDDTVVLDLEVALVPLSVLIGSIIISLSVFFSVRNISVDTNSASQNEDTQANEDQEIPTLAQEEEEASEERETFAETTIENAGFLGSDDAKVVVVEYSDMKCPYCAQYHKETYKQIKENYVDSGQVAYVYKHLPLFAEKEAVVAECVRKYGDDDKFFSFIESIFSEPEGNGSGVSVDRMTEIASNLGVDQNKFSTCVENEETLDLVNQQFSEATDAGIGGTPGFIIGTREGNTVDGKVVSGAQPYSVFEGVIEEYL